MSKEGCRMKPEQNRNERNSSGITEPVGAGKSSGESVFVIQKHDSKKLHWDLRLQMGGVLRSWAGQLVPCQCYLQSGSTLCFLEIIT